MTDTTFAYQSLISPRSRRLRTTGLFLLAVIVVMALYGYFSLMPSLRISAARLAAQANARPAATNSAVTTSGNRVLPTAKPTNAQDAVARMPRQEREAQAAKIVFAYAYWGVCLSLLIALMLVAWLDFREVGRNFDQQQAAIFAASLKNENSKN